jgi:hypothetical protein
MELSEPHSSESSALLRPAESSSTGPLRMIGLSRADRSTTAPAGGVDHAHMGATNAAGRSDHGASVLTDEHSFIELDSAALWVTTTRLPSEDFASLRNDINLIDPHAIVSDQLHSEVQHDEAGSAVPTALFGSNPTSAFSLQAPRRERDAEYLAALDVDVDRPRRRRVFAASERLVAFSLEPLVKSAALRNMVTWKYWHIFFFGLCCIFEVAILIPSTMPASTEIYIGCMLVCGSLFYINISQYSRQTFVYCLKTFDFWYQFVNFAVLVIADTYANVQLFPHGDSIIVPHIYQAAVVCTSVFTIDACFRLGFIMRSLVVCYYGLVILGVLIVWRVRLRSQYSKPVDVGVTTFEIASVAESTAFTCGVFMLRFGYNYIIRKRPTVLINFRLIEVTSPAEQLELERRCEFSIAFGTADPEEQHRVVSETMSLLAVRIPRAEVYLVSPSLTQSQSRQRCYTPKHCALSVDGAAFVHARWLEWLTAHRLWKWVHVVAVAGLVLGVAPIPTSDPELACRVGIQFVCGTVFALNISQYSRGVVRSVLKTFEFWFLIVQVAILCACNAYRAFSDAGWRHLPSCLFAWLLFFASALLQDGGNFSRLFKTVTNLEAAVLMAWTIASWRIYDVSVADNPIGLFDFSSTLGSLAQSSALNVLTYCVRYAYTATVFGTDTVLWFNAVAVESHYARDATVAESTMARSLTACARSGNANCPVVPVEVAASPAHLYPTPTQPRSSIAATRSAAASTSTLVPSTASFQVTPTC